MVCAKVWIFLLKLGEVSKEKSKGKLFGNYFSDQWSKLIYSATTVSPLKMGGGQVAKQVAKQEGSAWTASRKRSAACSELNWACCNCEPWREMNSGEVWAGNHKPHDLNFFTSINTHINFPACPSLERWGTTDLPNTPGAILFMMYLTH